MYVCVCVCVYIYIYIYIYTYIHIYIPSHTYSFIIKYIGSLPVLLCQKPGVAASFIGISAYSETRNYKLMAGECRTHVYCIYLQNKYITITIIK